METTKSRSLPLFYEQNSPAITQLIEILRESVEVLKTTLKIKQNLE